MTDPTTTFPRLQAVLQEYGVALRNAYQDNLIKSDRIATGDLLNSIEVRVDGPNGGQWSVVLNLEAYWKWVEDDTKPHWPPRSAILAWIRAKPVIPKPDVHGRIPKPESLAFLIARRIAGKAPDGHGGFKPGGTKGSHDLERAEADILPGFYKRIGDALLQDASDGMRFHILEAFREINPAPVDV